MLPIRDHNPSGRTPFFTYGLIALNILIFVSYLRLFGDEYQLGVFYLTWGTVPVQITSGENLISLITSMFLHGGFMHLAGNMLFLWIFGDNLEDEMGHFPFLVFYLLSGLLASLAQVATEPFSQVPIVGASGAIAGVMGGYLLLFPKARVDILIFLVIIIRVLPIPAWIVLVLWFAMQFIGGISADPNTGGVAYWAHAGGFVAGLLLTLPLWRKRGGASYWHRTDCHPPHPEARYRYVKSSIPKVKRKK